METPNRRSRMRRVSAGKRIELTHRDMELFKLLNRYRYLRSNFLYSFLGGNSETRFKERLGHLYHDGRYINRPPQQWQFANCRHMPLIYELDDKGDQVLRQQGLIQTDSPLLQKGRAGACRQFAHELMICDCIASIELGVREDRDLRFISWQEIIAKAPETTRALHNPFENSGFQFSHSLLELKGIQRADIKIVPDALFGLEYTTHGQKSYRFFALEADRNQMPVARSNLRQSSYLKKILAYRAIAAENIYKSHLGLPNFLVLNVITNERHMKSIMALLDEITAKKGSQTFLFKSISTLGDFRIAPRLDLSFTMNNRRILIANLAKGTIGEQAANLLGSLLVSHLQLIAMERGALTPEQRVPFFAHIDEFQTFSSDAFASLLSEARKFALHFALANQFTAQLSRAVRAAVIGNAGTLIVFRVGSE